MSNKFTRDLHQEITDIVIKQLEELGSDWVKPWSAVGSPINANSKNYYNGINVILLGLASYQKNYTSNVWATFKQWKDKGGNVKKGEHGTTGVFYKILNIKEKNKLGNDVEKHIPLLKHFNLFNAEQVEGVDVSAIETQKLTENEIIESAQSVVDATHANIKEFGGRACFIPSKDEIHIPVINAFVSSEDYYSTLFHELTHWSGHESRINRDLKNRFGSESYAAEELIAELGAAIFCGHTGVSATPREDHAKYLNNWLKILRNDKKAIFTAASKAQKAVDFILNLDKQLEEAA